MADRNQARITFEDVRGHISTYDVEKFMVKVYPDGTAKIVAHSVAEIPPCPFCGSDFQHHPASDLDTSPTYSCSKRGCILHSVKVGAKKLMERADILESAPPELVESIAKEDDGVEFPLHEDGCPYKPYSKMPAHEEPEDVPACTCSKEHIASYWKGQWMLANGRRRLANRALLAILHDATYNHSDTDLIVSLAMKGVGMTLTPDREEKVTEAINRVIAQEDT